MPLCLSLTTARLARAFFFALAIMLFAGAPSFADKNARAWVSDGMDIIRRSGDMCTLTFDDGPSRHSAKLLDTLKHYNVPATFFVVGTQVEHYKSIIRRMVAEGHEVGNHSYSHSTLRDLSPEMQQADLRKLDSLLRELGVTPRFIRPPYGIYDHNTINVVQELNGHIVMWSVDSQDWRQTDELENILENMELLYEGAPMRGVFLFHDTHRLTVERMPQIIEALAASGCRFVTLQEYIYGPAGTPAGPSTAPLDQAQGIGNPAAPGGNSVGPASVSEPAGSGLVPAPGIIAPPLTGAPAQDGSGVLPDRPASMPLASPIRSPGSSTPPISNSEMQYTLTLPPDQPGALDDNRKPKLPAAQTPILASDRDLLERILDTIMPQ